MYQRGHHGVGATTPIFGWSGRHNAFVPWSICIWTLVAEVVQRKLMTFWTVNGLFHLLVLCQNLKLFEIYRLLNYKNTLISCDRGIMGTPPPQKLIGWVIAHWKVCYIFTLKVDSSNNCMAPLCSGYLATCISKISTFRSAAAKNNFVIYKSFGSDYPEWQPINTVNQNGVSTSSLGGNTPNFHKSPLGFLSR